MIKTKDGLPEETNENYIFNNHHNAFLFLLACDAAGKLRASAENNQNANTISSNVSPNKGPVPEATPPKKSSSANTSKNDSAPESLPRRIDETTAESPIYSLTSKNCQAEQATDDYYVRCKAYGDYILIGTGYDRIDHYSIEPKGGNAEFAIELMPLAKGDAAKYQYNDKFVQKLGDKITWLLDSAGKPFAIFVHTSIYKATGSGKTFDNPKNKVAEFVFLRGLSVSEDLDYDLPADDTAYNPDEQARMIAYKSLKK